MNGGAYPMSNGLSRLQVRFLGEPEIGGQGARARRAVDAQDALEAGLVSFAPDDIDWDDEVRMAIEARAAFSPDALTGMEANLRFAGPETLETKIFGRLTAWQNWILQAGGVGGAAGRDELGRVHVHAHHRARGRRGRQVQREQAVAAAHVEDATRPRHGGLHRGEGARAPAHPHVEAVAAPQLRE